MFWEKCRKLNASFISIDNITDPINHDILQPEIWERLKVKTHSNADVHGNVSAQGKFSP